MGGVDVTPSLGRTHIRFDSGYLHTMTIFESAESAHAHVVATKLEGPSFELAMSDGMTFDGDPDLIGMGMALVLDAILAQGY